jgi:hypothetical protein
MVKSDFHPNPHQYLELPIFHLLKPKTANREMPVCRQAGKMEM